MSQPKAPTFGDRYGDGKTRRRCYAAEPTIDSANVDFVMPQSDKKRVPGQNYFVFAYAAPEGARVRCKNIAIKISGAFNTKAEADCHAQAIRDEDDRFDVHVIENGWVVIPIPEDVKPLIHKEYTDKVRTIRTYTQCNLTNFFQVYDENHERTTTSFGAVQKGDG